MKFTRISQGFFDRVFLKEHPVTNSHDLRRKRKKTNLRPPQGKCDPRFKAVAAKIVFIHLKKNRTRRVQLFDFNLFPPRNKLVRYIITDYRSVDE